MSQTKHYGVAYISKFVFCDALVVRSYMNVAASGRFIAMVHYCYAAALINLLSIYILMGMHFL